MSEPLSCEERGGFCAVRTLSERCQNTVRTLSELCQNGQVSVRTGVGAPQTRLAQLQLSCAPLLETWQYSGSPQVLHSTLYSGNESSHQ